MGGIRPVDRSVNRKKVLCVRDVVRPVDFGHVPSRCLQGWAGEHGAAAVHPVCIQRRRGQIPVKFLQIIPTKFLHQKKLVRLITRLAAGSIKPYMRPVK